MRLLTTMLAGAVACAGSVARAQTPIGLPPLPGENPPALAASASPMPQGEGTGSATPPMTVSSPHPGARTGGCTPGHCSHRLAIAKRRCKRHLQELFLGYPEEFERPPLGAMMYAVNRQAVRNAEEASLALRAYDFEPGTDRLNRRGRDKLAEISAKLPVTFGPVIVERSRDDAIDDARRSTVLSALKAGSFPIPPERVVVGAPASPGLRGPEAELIYDTLLQNTSMAGPPVGTGVAPSNPSGQR